MVLLDRSKAANTAPNRKNSHNERKLNISVALLASRGRSKPGQAKGEIV
jgi:hypothetical protein